MNISLMDKIKDKFPKFYLKEVTNSDFKLKPENDDGYVEYKRTLVDCSEKKAAQYATQMQWRIKQNIKNQFATYYIGVDDDGTIIGLSEDDTFECLNKFVSIASTVGASIIGIEIIHINSVIVIQIKVRIKKAKDNYIVEFDQDI